MILPLASLEHWMRSYYFDCKYDLGSSGVFPYDFGEVLELATVSYNDLNAVLLNDSPTRGSFQLREAIANRYGDGNSDHVMTANGSNEILYHLLTTLLSEGDEVVVLDTVYHALDAVPIAKKCRMKYWKMDKKSDFKVDVKELKSLVTNETKLIAVNFPHNPTGVTISKEEQDALIKIAMEVNAYLIWDAAFCELTLNDRLSNPFLSYEKAISVGTLSKSYGLPGLRLGWCFANEDIIQRSLSLRDYTTLYVSPLIEAIATQVITHGEKFISGRMQHINSNKRLLGQWFAINQFAVKGNVPEAGVTCLIKIFGIPNMDAFCRTLAEKYSVMLVPGSCFGHQEYARLGFGASEVDFKCGLELLTICINECLKETKLSLLKFPL